MGDADPDLDAACDKLAASIDYTLRNAQAMSDELFRVKAALILIATGDGYYGAQARQFKNIAREALGMEKV